MPQLRPCEYLVHTEPGHCRDICTALQAALHVRIRGSAFGDHRSKVWPRPVPEFLVLTRCAACYDQKGHSMPRHRADSESSSEVSDQEGDWDSDTSSSCSSEAATRPGGAEREDTALGSTPASGSTATDQGGLGETRAAGGEAEARGEMREGAGDRDIKDTKPPLLKTPSRGLLCRPPSVVSTLHLQALPSNHRDVTVYTQVGNSCPE
ncbi:unnamed protein product [Merluccius merluccius]